MRRTTKYTQFRHTYRHTDLEDAWCDKKDAHRETYRQTSIRAQTDRQKQREIIRVTSSNTLTISPTKSSSQVVAIFLVTRCQCLKLPKSSYVIGQIEHTGRS